MGCVGPDKAPDEIRKAQAPGIVADVYCLCACDWKCSIFECEAGYYGEMRGRGLIVVFVRYLLVWVEGVEALRSLGV